MSATSARQSDAGTLVRPAPLQLGTLHTELARIAALGGDWMDVRRAQLELFVRIVNGAGAACVSGAGDADFTVGPTVVATAAHTVIGDFDRAAAEAAAAALSAAQATVRPLPDTPGFHFVVAPLPARADTAPAALVLLLPGDPAASAWVVVIAQLFAALLAPPRAADEVTPSDDWAAIVAAGDRPEETLAAIARQLAAQFDDATVIIGTRRRGAAGFELGASSQAPGYDRRARAFQDLMALMATAATLEYPHGTGADDGAAAARQVLAQFGLAALTLVQLEAREGDDETRCVAALTPTAAPPVDAVALRAAAATWAPLLDLRRHGYPGRLGRAIRGLSSGRRRTAIAAAALALLAAGAWPVNDRIDADALLEPATRRVVSAPFDAILAESLVRAGDTVTKGAAVARLDDRDLVLQRDSLATERDRFRQHAQGRRAAGDLGGAREAELEALKLEAQLALVERRLEQVVLRSPIAGRVLRGELDKEQGRALTTGQPLLEIAPLERLRVELQVPADAIARVAPGAVVRLQLEALAGERLEVPVERIRPRAETLDRRRYFVAEAELANPDGRLRPGMRGHGAIAGERTVLAWRLFRAPVDALRRWQPW